jgi:hypothetical protein
MSRGFSYWRNKPSENWEAKIEKNLGKTKANQ